MDEAGVCVDKFEAFCEAALSEKLALDVPANTDIAILLLKLLLDDRLLLSLRRSRLLCALTWQHVLKSSPCLSCSELWPAQL